MGDSLNVVRVCYLVGALAVALGTLPASGGGQGDRPLPTSSPDTGGWLQLQRDQRVYRERVEPLSPEAEANLRLLEDRERTDLRALEQRQRLERQALPERQRVEPGVDLKLRQRQRRERESWRLERRIEREGLGHHR